MEYQNYFTNEDLVPRGYDLYADGVLEDTHFKSRTDAVNDFCENAFNIIKNLIEKYRGIPWTAFFLDDMKRTDLTGMAKKFQDAFKTALIEQCIYTYDNGDASASKYVGESHYAPKAVEALWGLVIRG